MPAEPSDPGAVEVTVGDTRSGVVVVGVAGDVDMGAVAAVRAGIDRAAAAAPRAVVLDMTSVDLLASAGLTLLLEARDALGGRGVSLLLVSARRTVLRPLQITGLDTVLERYDDLAGALAAASG